MKAAWMCSKHWRWVRMRCVGRELMRVLKDGGIAVTERIGQMNRELMSIMARTGAKTLKQIDPAVLYFRHS